MTATFRSGAAVVGTATAAVDADTTQLYYSSTVPFDNISITVDGGFALDNLTLVPEPTCLGFLGLIGGLGHRRRRRE